MTETKRDINKKYDLSKNDEKNIKVSHKKMGLLGSTQLNNVLTTQFVNHLSPNDLLSFYLSSKESQKMLDNAKIIDILNNKYNVNMNTTFFTTWYKYYLYESSIIPDQNKYLYKLENIRYIDNRVILYDEDLLMDLFETLHDMRRKFKLSIMISAYVPTLVYVLLTLKKGTKDNLLLYGCCCLHYATILFDIYPPEMGDYVFLAKKAGGDFSEKELQDAILETMNLYNGQLIYPAPIFFMDQDSYIFPLLQNLAILVSTILPLTNYKPSLIAETCNWMITGKNYIYSKQEIYFVCDIINKFLNKYQDTELKHMKERMGFASQSINYSSDAMEIITIDNVGNLKYNEPWHLGDVVDLNDVGEGTFGKVRSVKRHCGDDYAIKSAKLEDVDYDAGLLEIGMLTLLKEQPHIIQLCGFIVGDDTLDIVLPLYEQSLKDVNFTGLNLWPYFKQILQAVLECHNHDIMHRDVKVENLLIKGDNIVLIDFGVSIPFQSFNKSQIADMANTSYYRPLECLFGDHTYGKGVDIWAVGCVFYYMITNTYIVNVSDDMSEKSIVDDIIQLLGTPTEKEWPGLYKLPELSMKTPISHLVKMSHYPGKIEHLHKILAPYDDLVLDCLTMDPDYRPTAKELLTKYF